MSKAALAKLSKEEALLDSHLTTLKRSATTVEACKELIAGVNTTDEPFADDYPKDNPWHKPHEPEGDCGCTLS